MSLVIFVVRHGYVTVLCVMYYIGHYVTRAMCCLVFGLEEFDFYSPNLFFIHQTYFWLVKYFSHILCTINGTSFVCENLNHAATNCRRNGTLGNIYIGYLVESCSFFRKSILKYFNFHINYMISEAKSRLFKNIFHIVIWLSN